jgi:chromosome segregation ATPase
MPDKDKQLEACRADFHAIKKELDKVASKVGTLEARLYGSNAEIGDMKELRGWMQSLSSEIGKVQLALKHIKEALK